MLQLEQTNNHQHHFKILLVCRSKVDQQNEQKEKKTLLEQREEEHKKNLQKEAKKESKKTAKKESKKEDNMESSSKPKPRRKVTCSFCSEEEHTIKTCESFREYKAMMATNLTKNVSFAPRKATQCNHAFTLKLRWQKSRDMLNRVICS